MCLILLAHGVHPRFPLVLAANRDEFLTRPSAPLGEWPDSPGVFGGRDLQAGGSWLAARPDGRWAAVTNYRSAAELERRFPRSRGDLVAGFVRGVGAPTAYARSLLPDLADFGGFNLLAGDGSEIVWLSNRAAEGEAPYRVLDPGIYGISNHLLDTPWPKVVRGKAELARLLERGGEIEPTALLEILLDRTLAVDRALPDTGVGTDLERALSAMFIRVPGYGTRASTALLRTQDGRTLLSERRFDDAGAVSGENHIEL